MNTVKSKTLKPQRPSRVLLKRAGSVSPEQWWTNHARLLAAKMKHGGVDSFRIWLNARGNYEFEVEVVPTGETLNVKVSDAPDSAAPNRSTSATAEQGA